MKSFPATEALPILRLALQEDIGPGDVTTRFLIPEDAVGKATFLVKGDGIVAGLPILQPLYSELDGRAEVELSAADGDPVSRGSRIATVKGPLRAILTGERAALNFLQRLSGIATLTRAFVERIRGTRARILDTRKTTPGLRAIEKYAVRVGGGENHRMGLYDGVMAKDNHRRHLFALAPERAKEVLARARESAPDRIPVIVEVESVQQVPQVLALDPDVVLFDNMTPSNIKHAVKMVRIWNEGSGSRIETEASGGITLEKVRAFADAGVDRISIGSLTHSSTALDISLEVE